MVCCWLCARLRLAYGIVMMILNILVKLFRTFPPRIVILSKNNTGNKFSSIDFAQTLAH